jgi:hypothetical protein
LISGTGFTGQSLRESRHDLLNDSRQTEQQTNGIRSGDDRAGAELAPSPSNAERLAIQLPDPSSPILIGGNAFTTAIG